MGFLNFNTQIRALQLRNNRAGSWIGARDYCLVNEMTGGTGGSYAAVVGIKTQSGHWTIGRLGEAQNRLEFVYTTDADYNANPQQNRATYRAYLRTRNGNLAFTDEIWSTVYPVGAIYMSTSSTSPASLFGGSWSQITSRFLWCTTTSNTTGGSQNKNISHSHGSGSLVANGGSINDRADTYGYDPTGANRNYPSGYGAGGGLPGFNHTNHATTISGSTESGGSTSLDIMPPWYSVYCWRRTA